MNVSRIALTTGIALSSVVLLSGTASAHVGVQPQGEAAKGGYATVNVKVPNERDNASTIKVEVNFPVDHPLASVMPQPVPGWKSDVTKSKLTKPLELHGKTINEAVTKVTWTAEGDAKIGPGQFQQFPLSLGQLPEADQLVIKAIQTYDNDEVVRWIEEPKDGAELQNPAPVLKLSAASDDHHGGGTKTDDKAGHDDKAKDGAKDKAKDRKAHTENAAHADSGSDTTARVLGVVGILIGVAGVAFGLLAGRRRSA
ncbi:YcnI family protein [Streptomyces sp. Je 1-79]|uniref:YcnI family copper-binding membrane protein n=1 Tax=Streptomyces sp. Je 1-79 TaxID=2943847 RepID=UPI0021A30CDD|nr:YcnI family protein [Streptomyces sp. Je 1-79]MCT4357623.1 YcnI family protein [Streptomyces sp. Je 1-79]